MWEAGKFGVVVFLSALAILSVVLLAVAVRDVADVLGGDITVTVSQASGDTWNLTPDATF